MKKILLVSVLMSVMLMSNSSIIAQVAEKSESKRVNYSDPETWILGYFDLDYLLSGVHRDWYFNGYDSYTPDQQAINDLKTLIDDDLSITIVMGTWCPDSRREFPRFMRILSLVDFPADRVIMVGVDSFKKAPVEDYETLGIERVPTFIILRNKNELGRIIEYPHSSLEQDMVDILKKK